MKNANLPISPIVNEYGIPRHSGSIDPDNSEVIGITKREYFAAMAMQGLLSNSGGAIQSNNMSGTGWRSCNSEMMAEWATECADALLSELDKESNQ